MLGSLEKRKVEIISKYHIVGIINFHFCFLCAKDLIELLKLALFFVLFCSPSSRRLVPVVEPTERCGCLHDVLTLIPASSAFVVA